MLIGNIMTTLNLNLRREAAASSIAERVRRNLDHFADEHCDIRIKVVKRHGTKPSALAIHQWVAQLRRILRGAPCQD